MGKEILTESEIAKLPSVKFSDDIHLRRWDVKRILGLSYNSDIRKMVLSGEIGVAGVDRKSWEEDIPRYASSRRLHSYILFSKSNILELKEKRKQMKKQISNNGLIGKFVYIVDSNKLHGEGQIINLIADKYCLVRMFSAMTGESNVETLISLDELCSSHYYLCDDETAKIVYEDYSKNRSFGYSVKRFNEE